MGLIGEGGVEGKIREGVGRGGGAFTKILIREEGSEGVGQVGCYSARRLCLAETSAKGRGGIFRSPTSGSPKDKTMVLGDLHASRKSAKLQVTFIFFGNKACSLLGWDAHRPLLSCMRLLLRNTTGCTVFRVKNHHKVHSFWRGELVHETHIRGVDRLHEQNTHEQE